MTSKAEKVGISLDQSLPPGWRMSTIGELLKVRNGYAFKSTDYREDGALLVRQSNLDGSRVSIEKAKYLPKDYLNEYEGFLIRKGDILIGMSGSIGKLCTYDRDEPALQNQRTGLLVFKDQEQKPWVWNYLPLLEKDLIKAGKGVAVLNVSASQIESFPIPIAPLDQQKRIVAEIEKQFSHLDEAVANFKRVKANLKRYKAAVLKAAVEGRLVETEASIARREGRSYETGEQLLQRILETRRSQWKSKGKYKEPIAPDTTDLPELPEGWIWASLGSLGEVIGGLTKNPKRSKLKQRLPYLRVANVYANELRLGEIEEIGVEDNELEKLLVHKGDLLIVEGNGSPDQIGRLAIWDGSISPCVHQNHLIKVRLHSEIAPEWIMNWLMSPNGRHCIREVASSTSGLYTLSVGKVSSLSVPLPPLNEQKRIIEEMERHISIVHDTETELDTNLQRAQRLRQSSLKHAFMRRSFCGSETALKVVPQEGTEYV